MLTGCSKCGLVIKAEQDNNFKMLCPRCSNVVCCRGVNMKYAMYFSMTSLLFTIPAVMFPFLKVDLQGISISATLFESALVLNNDGYCLAAVIVICTAFLFPFLYMLLTLYLSFESVYSFKLPMAEKCAKLVEKMKHWQMVDVFLVGILVTIVKLVSMADIEFGAGFYMLSLQCIFMILSGTFYDNKYFWNQRSVS